MSRSDALPVDDADPREMAELEERIGAFNEAATGIPGARWLTILSRDDAGALAAGLHGWTWERCFYVVSLWVTEALRRRGHGSRLLQAGEEEARRRGCRTAFLDTFSFQAPAFYARHGYRVVAEVPGHPGGSTRLHLRKVLEAP